jgi:hypothetical protein
MTEDKDEEDRKIERRGKDDWRKGIGCMDDGRQRRREYKDRKKRKG